MQIDRDRLYYYVEDYHIFQYYIGDFEIDDKLNSPLREDNRPSFQIKMSSNDRLYWVDYGIEQDYFDGIELVSLMYNISREEAILKIWKDLVINGGIDLAPVPIKSKPFKIPYEFEYQDISPKEMTYWEARGITKKQLDKYNVKSLKGLYRSSTKLLKSTLDQPVFIYLFEEGSNIFKSYQPGGDIWKWRGQDNGMIIEGWSQLEDTSDILLITSSLKDTMVLDRLGFNACNPTSENSFQAILEKLEEINSRFKKVYIFFDNDSAGIKSAISLSEKTGWTPIALPYSWGCKDPSDLTYLDRNFKRLKIFLKKMTDG